MIFGGGIVANVVAMLLLTLACTAIALIIWGKVD